ncbi:MAG TPA: adventurous gliding motility TPR repeat lipoprotein GltE [Anaeromyxobacteraceae bacterium]|nr:adventurous gliding motility TPR repeat lipoprotein GltE [Anaeromyxobacteraceae bacterium]
MTRPTPAALLAALALAALSACAGAPPAPTPKPAAASKPAAEAEEPLSARGQRRFDEAVRAHDEQAKAKAVDWAILERRWRGVLEDADLAEAHYNLGVTLERQGRLDEARAEYQRALQQKPLRQAAVNLGVLLEREGDARGAAAAYADAARDFPEDAASRARLGALYRQSGQLDEAWRLSREALLRDPANATAYKTMIRVALARNDADLGKLVALRAQKVAPDDAEVAFLSGQLVARQGDEAGAAAQWRRALQLRPGFLPARTGLLEGAVKHERWAEAAEQAGGILADDASNAPVQLVRGVALRHLGKADEALAAYGAAEQLGAGKLPEVHLARGILLMREKSDCAGALVAFDQYEKAVGPVLPQGSPAPRLMRECQEQVEQGRQAAEAARQMQLEAEKKAAQEAAKKAADAAAAAPAATPTPGEGTTPTPPPAPSKPPPGKP